MAFEKSCSNKGMALRRSERRKSTSAASTVFPMYLAPDTRFVTTNAREGYMYFGHGATLCKNSKLVYKVVPDNCILITRAECGSATLLGHHYYSEINNFLRLNLDELYASRKLRLTADERNLPLFQKSVWWWNTKQQNVTFHIHFPGDTYPDIVFQPMLTQVDLRDQSEAFVNVSTDNDTLWIAGLYDRRTLMNKRFQSDYMSIVETICPEWFSDLDFSSLTTKKLWNAVLDFMYGNAWFPYEEDLTDMRAEYKSKQGNPSFASERQYAKTPGRFYSFDKTNYFLSWLGTEMGHMFDHIYTYRQLLSVPVSELMALHPGVHYFGLCRGTAKDCDEAVLQQILASKKHSPDFS